MAMVELDVVAVVDLCTRFLPGMVERGRGAVLNVASTAAFQPLPGQAAYAAGKAFVLSYTHSLIGELRGTGVTATALCPGPVKTGVRRQPAGFTEEQEDDSLPSIMWVSAEEVAKAAVAGLDKGRAVVIPGMANRVGASFAQVTPAVAAGPDPGEAAPRPALRFDSGSRHHRPPGCMVGAPRSREESCVVVRSRSSLAGSLALTLSLSVTSTHRRQRHRPSRTTRVPRVRPRTRPRSGRAARSPRSTRTPPGSGCGCCRTAATPSTPRSPPRPRSASPSPTAPASAAAATSSTTTRSPAGCTPSTAARPPARDAERRVHRPRDRRAVRAVHTRTWSPAACRSGCPAPPRPGPPRWTGGASKRLRQGARAGRTARRARVRGRRDLPSADRGQPGAVRGVHLEQVAVPARRPARGRRALQEPRPRPHLPRVRQGPAAASTAGKMAGEIVDVVRQPTESPTTTTLPVPPGFIEPPRPA